MRPDQPGATHVSQSLRDMLAADLNRQRSVRGLGPIQLSAISMLRELPNFRFHPVVLLRLSLAFAANGGGVARLLAKVVSYVNIVTYGVEIALNASVGPGLYLPHPGGIVLGAARIGSDATIFQGVTLGASTIDLDFDASRRPVLGDRVTIGAGAKVIGAVSVGDDASVGANCVVVKDVPSGDVVGGIPASSLRGAASNDGDLGQAAPEQRRINVEESAQP